MSMNIFYSDTKDIEINQLQSLFASVQWDSANYPEKLCLAINNSHGVTTAWDGNKLIGLMNALSDGVMTAYFHYLLVKYSECARKVLIAYEQEAEFYKQCGFEVGEGKIPMFVTYLRT